MGKCVTPRSVLSGKRIMKIIRAGIIYFLLPAVSSFAFTTPERLEYNLKWVGIHAGTALLGIDTSGETYVITSRALSAKYISLFYKVDDRVECIIDGRGGEFGYSLNYRLTIREGRHRRDKEVIFDHALNKAVYVDRLKDRRREYEISGNTYDPLSGFYAIRRRNLQVGKTVKVSIFDSKKSWDVEVEVLRKEKVEVPAGVFNAIVIKPKLKSEGIFRRKGDIFIWLTDNKKKVPVKLRTEAPIGYITAELTGGEF